MEGRLGPPLQPPGHYRLGDAIRHGGDGDFILPLLQSRLGRIWCFAFCAGRECSCC